MLLPRAAMLALLLTMLAWGPAWAQDPGEPPTERPPAPAPAPASEGAPAQGEGTAPGAEAAEPAAPAAAPLVPRYRRHDELWKRLESWSRAYPGRALAFELGRSAGGLSIPALEVGAEGPVPLSQRPTVWLVGGLDGVSIAGGEAVLAAVEALLGDLASIGPDFAFVAVPWASPDGLARWSVGHCVDGRNGGSLDDDGDGALDEDGAEDVDGDGLVLRMLVEHPDGAWAFGADPRFPVPARDGDWPRYHERPEGRDDDGDGLFNEDGPGGVDLDLNFPVGWPGPRSGFAAGPLPLSEPGSRALADAVLTRRTALVLLFQGNHGRLALPGGVADGPLPFDRDRAAFAALGAALAGAGERTGEPLRLCEARGEPRPGAAIDWLYSAAGALAAEVAFWGPGRAERGQPTDARFAPQDAADERLSELQRAWGRWLDDQRGGIGFVDWQPVDLGGGVRGLVGGWEPRTCFNPSEQMLPEVVRGARPFALALARSLPRLSIELVRTERRGELVRVEARVRNLGTLPTGIVVPPGAAPRGVVLRVEPPVGARAVAGDAELALGHLAAGAASATHTWLFVAPPDATFRLAARGDWTAEVALEVHP